MTPVQMMLVTWGSYDQPERRVVARRTSTCRFQNGRGGSDHMVGRYDDHNRPAGQPVYLSRRSGGSYGFFVVRG